MRKLSVAALAPGPAYTRPPRPPALLFPFQFYQASIRALCTSRFAVRSAGGDLLVVVAPEPVVATQFAVSPIRKQAPLLSATTTRSTSKTPDENPGSLPPAQTICPTSQHVPAALEQSPALLQLVFLEQFV